MKGTASAPASSGNLGPGFDTLAVALDIRCTVSAVASPRWSVEEGNGERVLADGDLIARAVDAAVGRPMHLEIRNDIPRSRGLGSSAAVAAASAAASMAALNDDGFDRERVYEIVADLEGHADNAAATVYGGVVAVAGTRIHELEIDPGLIAVIAVPGFRLPTKQARSALSARVPRDTVVRSLGRLAFLIEGLRTADRDLLGAAGGDELHEGPRSELSPVSGALMAAARDGGAFHAAWSGAGPSVLAICETSERDNVVTAFESVLEGDGFVLGPAFDWTGLLRVG